MVQATVDNDVVSISLGTEETVTVPDGETWRVTLSFTPNDRNNNEAFVRINGRNVGFSHAVDEQSPGNATIVIETVLTSGDSVSSDRDAQGHIGGFVVS